MDYIFELDPTSKKFTCPSCEKRTFVKFINKKKESYLSSEYGRCDREEKCGYFLFPSGKNTSVNNNIIPFNLPQKKIYDTIPKGLVNPTFKAYESNNFIGFLEKEFGYSATNKVINNFFIGSSKYQFRKKDFRGYLSKRGATIFWQIDISGKVRTGKLMLYNAKTGKRIKEPFNHISWAHSILKYKKMIPNDFKLGQCLFGEHQLIKNSDKEIGIVEGEKTAVILTILIPEILWLAVGFAGGLNKDKFKSLTGRKITLYPDLGQYEKWKDKAKEIINCEITVSKLLETKATERDKKNGFDLADYLLKKSPTPPASQG